MALVSPIVSSACSHDWDPYDPRLGGAGGGASSSLASSSTAASSTTSSGSGGEGGASSSSSGSGGEAASSSSGGGGGAGGGGPLVVEVPATVAACMDPTDPTPVPAECTIETGPGAFTVDAEADPPRNLWHAFLRFELDGTLAGRTVESVSLRLVVAGFRNSNSSQTGEVWEVESFDLASLSIDDPALVGGAPLEGNLGAVDQGETVVFALDGLTVTPDAPVFLGILPVSGDGVDYLDQESVTPPTLVITYH